jgi:hypothetical protein
MFIHFVGSEESTTTVWTAGNEFCLSYQNIVCMVGSGLVQILCELACFVISRNSMKLSCHSNTSQNTLTPPKQNKKVQIRHRTLQQDRKADRIVLVPLTWCSCKSADS